MSDQELAERIGSVSISGESLTGEELVKHLNLMPPEDKESMLDDLALLQSWTILERGSARLYECSGCGEQNTQDRFPDDPAVPGLCAACDLLVRSEDEPLEVAHRNEITNKKRKVKPDESHT